MEFAKYYKVTGMLNKLIEDSKVFGYTKGYYKDLFVCQDTHDIWVCRILEGYNEEYEEEAGKWLVERNKIDKYDFVEFLKEKKNDDSEIDNRNTRDYYINECFQLHEVLENIILMDDDNGLEGWDILETESYEECIEAVDGGFGIIDFEVTQG